jgi:hypothetical protein
MGKKAAPKEIEISRSPANSSLKLSSYSLADEIVVVPETDDEKVRRLVEENEALRVKLQTAEKRLADTLEINDELKQAKQALSDEILDLTKVLFEEANGMVANEVRARTQLESSKRKLQNELDTIQERLRIESQQLKELKQKLYATSNNGSNTSLSSVPSKNIDEMPIYSTINFDNANYFEMLFSERRFSSRTKCNLPGGASWRKIIGSVDVSLFDSFTKFLEVIGKLNDESFIGNPFVKRLCEIDVVPCLSFECKPKSFIKSVVFAMLKNNCIIETINQSSVVGSPVSGRSLSNGTESQQISPKVEFETYDMVSTPLADSSAKFFSLMSELTISLSSIAEPAFSPAVTDAQNRKCQPYLCALCGSKLEAADERHQYKFRLSDKDIPMTIDGFCREKLVAVAEFFTFLRHLRRGLFASRPIIDLYFEVLHYRRSMFYARTGSLTFFLASDLDSLLHSRI